MSATNKTANYELPLFVDDDQPTWLGDFNGAMNKIDAGLGQVGVNATTALNAANNAVLRVASAEESAASAKETAGQALSLAQTNEQDIAVVDAQLAGTRNSGLKSLIDKDSSRIAALIPLEGAKNAKYVVFSDDSAITADGYSAWDYFKDILAQDIDMEVYTAPSGTGWVAANSSGQNANAYVTTMSDSVAVKEAISYVVLNYGWYDIKNNASGDYETAGRQIVNTVHKLYPNAVVIVNPLSNAPCYGYNREAQVNAYLLVYGMCRSQVPLKCVPWQSALTLNKGISHHYESVSEGTLNKGGVQSVGSNIKMCLFGSEYERQTRDNLANSITDYFTVKDSEFITQNGGTLAALTAGSLTTTKVIDSSTTVGTLANKIFAVTDDTILATLVQNTSTTPIKGHLVLLAKDNSLVVRLNEGVTSINSGVILRLTGCATYHPAYKA